jgi:hypothetical protein
MWQLFKEGGFPMWFVVTFGLVALATALVFAIRPRREQEGFIIGMSHATLFSVLAGVAADFSAVSHAIESHRFPDSQTPLILIEGFGESMSPCIFGFPMLSLVWLMVAVGRRRLDARDA